MKLKKSNLILLIFFVFFFSSISKSHALSSGEFIRLMTGWTSPDNLKIYENEEFSRKEENFTITNSTMPSECKESSECEGTATATSVSTGASKTITISGTCIKQDKESQYGRCQENKSKSVSIGTEIIGTDFSEEISIIPKLQEGISHYFQPTPLYSNNILSFGSHQLLLSEQDQTSLKIDYLKKANITKNTFETTGEYPLGGVDYNKEIDCNGNIITPIKVWNSLPKNVKSKSQGWYKIYRNDQKNDLTWTQNLFCISPYRTIEEDAFARSSILFGSHLLIDKESIYTDSHVKGTFDASLIDAKLTFPSVTYKKIYNNVKSKFPLIEYLENPTLEAIPSTLIKTSPQNSLGIKEFSAIIDNESAVNNKYHVIGTQIIKEEANAVKDQGFTSNIISSVIESIFKLLNIRTHVITIPGIAGQATELLQQEIYLTQVASTENSNTDVTKLSNSVVGTDGNTLIAGSGGIPGIAKNTISRLLACNSTEYSTFDTSIKDYVSGVRNSCDSEMSLAGSCDGKLFHELYGDELPKISSQAESKIETQIPNITPEALGAYKAAEEKTGVPCEILAGIHWIEGSNNENQDLQEGADLNGRSLVESANNAAEELEGKVGIKKDSKENIESVENLITALSRYNGGGNSNCQGTNSYNCSFANSSRCGYTTACTANSTACTCTNSPDSLSCRVLCQEENGYAFPFKFSYGGTCPSKHEGYDDPYATNLLKPEQDTMYILYRYDCTQTRPIVATRPGAFTFAVGYYNLVSK